MAVDYDYYRKLEEEYYALFKKYDDMKLGDKLQELKPFEKRYEVIPKYVKFAPHAGRYDHFFYQGLGKRKYKPAKKLFPELPNVTNDVYEYNYKNDKIVFVRGWEYSVDDEELWCATSCYCITNEGYVRVNERTKVTEEIFLIEKQEHSTEYLCLWRPLLGTPTFTQFIVPDEGDYYDEYRVIIRIRSSSRFGKEKKRMKSRIAFQKRTDIKKLLYQNVLLFHRKRILQRQRLYRSF